jgi:hypothetical protein
LISDHFRSRRHNDRTHHNQTPPPATANIENPAQATHRTLATTSSPAMILHPATTDYSTNPSPLHHPFPASATLPSVLPLVQYISYFLLFPNSSFFFISSFTLA